ncbi:aminoglycoside phosphotransferase, partial [Bifidobacterium pseudocatenulatum]|nr:aminoglycoside phosphotransferase [Bifidobacterium pseudocatenulatum]
RPQRPPSTITVGTLLNDSERRLNAAALQNDSDTTVERHVDAVDMDDSTVDFDATGDFDVTGYPPVRKPN